MELKDFFSYIRRNRSGLARGKIRFCESLATRGPSLPAEIREFLEEANIDDRNYAVSSAYALLIGDDRRKRLSAYFTPPALARAALDAAIPFLRKIPDPSILDPACGGGSFLTPVARYLISRKCKRGLSTGEACKAALKSIRGIEIDSGLAALSQFLLRAMLKSEWGVESKEASYVVQCADALGVPTLKKYDLVIGNPPFGKVGERISGSRLKQAGLANLGGHTNLYSLFLLRGLEWVKPGGGLVFILPPSFVAGPYFAGLRQELLHRAEIMRIDLHERRDQLFLGAVQDICLLTLKKWEAQDDRDRGLSRENLPCRCSSSLVFQCPTFSSVTKRRLRSREFADLTISDGESPPS